MIGIVVPFALSSVIARCAPEIGPVTMSAIVAYESGAMPYAIGDNTRRRSYVFGNAIDATVAASRLIRAGHNIDVGYAQINSTNLSRYGLTVRDAFDPCTNVATGARILADAYRRATHTYGFGQVALVHALSAYNSGDYVTGISYAGRVYRTAARLRFGVVPRSTRARQGGLRAAGRR